MRKILFTSGLIWCWILFSAPLAFGQELTFEASVDQTRVGVNDILTFTVSVSGADLSGVPEPTLPEMPNFFTVGRTSSTSSNIGIVNGSITSSRTIQYIYQLQPREIGKFTIDAATIRHGGRTYRTTPITIDVIEGSVNSGGGSRSAGRSAREPLRSDETLTKDGLFVSATLNKTEVYLGEQVTVSYDLYTRVGLSNVQYDKIPSFIGFWMEEIFSAEHLDFSPNVVDGKRYDVAPLKRVALFPTVVGEQTFEPLSILCDVPVARRRNLFDSFFDDPFDSFFGRTQRTVIHSNTHTIRILPLPTEGKSAHFSGGVGRFTLTSSIDQKEIEANQPLTLKVILKGEGNLRTVDEPVLPDMPAFRQYTSSSEENMTAEGGRIGGTKTYNYVLIPLSSGAYEIPPVTFDYFDPSEKSYKTARTAPIAISVAPGQGAPVGADYTANRSAVTQLARDIQYIKPETVALSQQGELLYQKPWFLLLHALPMFSLIGIFVYNTHAQRLQHDVGYARWRRAHGAARHELREADSALKRDAVEEVYTNISRAIHTYIGDKCNVSVTGLTGAQIANLLKKRGVKEDTLEALTQCLDACDMARFAPSTLTPESTREILDTAKRVISELEQRLVKTT